MVDMGALFDWMWPIMAASIIVAGAYVARLIRVVPSSGVVRALRRAPGYLPTVPR